MKPYREAGNARLGSLSAGLVEGVAHPMGNLRLRIEKEGVAPAEVELVFQRGDALPVPSRSTRRAGQAGMVGPGGIEEYPGVRSVGWATWLDRYESRTGSRS